MNEPCTTCKENEVLLTLLHQRLASRDATVERQRKEILQLKTDLAEMNVRIHERTQGFLRRVK